MRINDVAIWTSPGGEYRPIVVGTITQGTENMLAARFTSEGTLDASFHENGILTEDVDGARDTGEGIAIQEDGRILVVGSAKRGSPLNHDFVVWRFHADGATDTSFHGGRQVITFGGEEFAQDIVVQPYGDSFRIVVAGQSPVGGGGGFNMDSFVARLNPDGSEDTSFSDDNGRLATGFGDNDGVLSLAVQPDGRILLGG